MTGKNQNRIDEIFQELQDNLSKKNLKNIINPPKNVTSDYDEDDMAYPYTIESKNGDFIINCMYDEEYRTFFFTIIYPIEYNDGLYPYLISEKLEDKLSSMDNYSEFGILVNEDDRITSIATRISFYKKLPNKLPKNYLAMFTDGVVEAYDAFKIYIDMLNKYIKSSKVNYYDLLNGTLNNVYQNLLSNNYIAKNIFEKDSIELEYDDLSFDDDLSTFYSCSFDIPLMLKAENSCFSFYYFPDGDSRVSITAPRTGYTQNACKEKINPLIKGVNNLKLECVGDKNTGTYTLTYSFGTVELSDLAYQGENYWLKPANYLLQIFENASNALGHQIIKSSENVSKPVDKTRASRQSSSQANQTQPRPVASENPKAKMPETINNAKKEPAPRQISVSDDFMNNFIKIKHNIQAFLIQKELTDTDIAKNDKTQIINKKNEVILRSNSDFNKEIQYFIISYYYKREILEISFISRFDPDNLDLYQECCNKVCETNNLSCKIDNNMNVFGFNYSAKISKNNIETFDVRTIYDGLMRTYEGMKDALAEIKMAQQY